MYALFSLGHTDVWPVDDLAVVVGLQRLKKLKERPNKKQMEKLGEPWRPYRGCVAIFLWHYYGAATLDEAAAPAAKGDKKTSAQKSKSAAKAKGPAKKQSLPKKKAAKKIKSVTKKPSSKKPLSKKKSVKKISNKKKITKPKVAAPKKLGIAKTSAGKASTGKTPTGKTPTKKTAMARRSYSLVVDPRLKGRRTQGRRMPAGGRRNPR